MSIVGPRPLLIQYIVLMTVMKVLKREGISQKGEATMEEFVGMEGA